MTVNGPPGDWVKIADRADGDRLVEEAMAENLEEVQRIIDGERDPRLKAALERSRPKIERQIREVLERQLDEVWANHLRREGRLG